MKVASGKINETNEYLNMFPVLLLFLTFPLPMRLRLFMQSSAPL